MRDAEDLGLALGDAHRLPKAGRSLAEVWPKFGGLLLPLRTRGADKIDSIKIVERAMSITVGQAKGLVDRSETWSDRFSHDRSFHQMVKSVASKLSAGSSASSATFEERSSDRLFQER